MVLGVIKELTRYRIYNISFLVLWFFVKVIVNTSPEIKVDVKNNPQPRSSAFDLVTLICPPDTSLICLDVNIDTVLLGRPFATTDCPFPNDTIFITFRDDSTGFNGSCLNDTVGIITRTFFVTDQCSPTDSCKQVIAFIDTLNPTILCPADTTLQCTDVNIDPSVLGTPVTSDFCSATDSIVVVFRDDSTGFDGNCINDTIGYITRTFIVMDECGNTDSCAQIIAFIDTVAPVFSFCPLDDTVDCGTPTDIGTLGIATATDICITPVTNIFNEDIIISGSCDNNYVIYRRWTAIDACGNQDTCVQLITVQDTMGPVFTFCPRDTTIDCDSPKDSLTLGTATATDNCTDQVTTIFFIDNMITGEVCEPNFIILRTWNATDSCGNTSTCLQTITVQDTSKPFITCPRDTLVDCDAQMDIAALGVAFASDNCSLDLIINEDSIIPGVCPNNYTIYRRWTAIDECGNQDTCVQLITVQDTTGPQFTVPGNIDTVQCGQFFDIVFPGAPAIDNCDGAILIQSDISIIDSTCPGNLKILLVYTATDSCNNTTTIRDTIVKIDTIPPLLTILDTVTITCADTIPDEYSSLDDFLLNGGTANDSCCLDSSSFSLVSSVFEFNGEVYVLTRTYSIFDCCGLNTSVTQVFLLPCIADLALRKVVDGPGPYFVMPGGTVPFTITVFSQEIAPGATNPIDSIKIIDYLPSMGSTILQPGWVNNGDGTACLTLTRGNQLPAGGLLPGQSVDINFTVQLGLDFLSATGVNAAEIASFEDTLDNTLNDWDSNPNSNPNDDTGPIDDEINDDGTFDEDDFDPAFFYTCRSLVCNNSVTISLNQDCEFCINGDDLLEGESLPNEFYEIDLYLGGVKLPDNCVNRAHIGYTLTYVVKSLATCDNNECWGYVKIEDKFPPQIDCVPDTVLCSELANIPVNIVAQDNCSGPVKVSIASEQFIDYGCDSVNIQGIVIRRLLATDRWGNTRDCEKYYYIRRVHIEDVVCPANVTLDCSQVGSATTVSPSVSGAPTVSGINLWPNNASCKLIVNYTDQLQEKCGAGFKILRTWIISDWCLQTDTLCQQTINVQDVSPPNAPNITLPTVKADPHDCRAPVQLNLLPYSDCGTVTQTYSYPYVDPATGAIKYATGTLPAKVFIYSGTTVINVTLTDACENRSIRTITVSVQDETAPTPVCHEYTRVTVDPVSCWSTVEAKSLDNGSHDNCCGELHYAAAHMDSVTYWRNYWNTKLELEVGKAAYKADKIKYDALIEDWINCYVFTDVLHFDNCGSNQVILRVYEACGLPRFDEHVWPCTPHQWFCYNTYLYMADFNYNWFDPAGPKSCDYRPELISLEKLAQKYESYETKGYLLPRFDGAARFEYCSVPFYFPEIQNNSDRGEGRQPGDYCSARLYSDCMIQVLVDDKQAPVIKNLRDITVYCDQAPAGTNYARLLCKSGDFYNIWPGTISSGGKIHGYYGGSDHITNHSVDVSEHNGPQAPGCGEQDSWSPIYCRDWLLLDNYDQAGKIDPKQYFSTLVKFDKYRPSRTLTNNEFSVTDNCRLDDESLIITDLGSLNSCGEGWFQRTWSIKDKCGNEVKAIQKVIVKHRSDFEVVFPEDLEVNCDVLDATDSSHTGKPVITDDECENIGLRYVDEISAVDDGACYKIIRTWTLIDWCIFDANIHTFHPDVIVDDRLRADSGDRACVFRNLKDNGDGYMKYVQIIKVIDQSAPVITCVDSTFCLQDGCSVNINIPIQTTDNCSEKVLLRLEITRPDGSVEKRTDVNSISGNFSAGIYHIKIIGKDKCHNEDTCFSTLIFYDCKKPTPYCLNGVATVVMPSTGTIEVWAKDLDRGSIDNCTPNSELRFSFSSNPSNASRVFSCHDILNGKQHAVEVQIWVTDNLGNQDWCKTYILLQDNGGQPGGVCKDTTLTVANISGRLYTEDKEGVEHATVEVKGLPTTPGIPAFKTASDGNFAFNSVQMVGDYVLKALRDDNPMNGVSTLDMILIQKHILGAEQLKSPYKMIAADINNSADVSVQDLIELRKLILGINEKLPNNTSWKFIPKAHSFVDLKNPWGYPTEDKLQDMQGANSVARDFVGVKIGDVNNSAIPHSLMGTEVRGNDKGLLFEVPDHVFNRGDLVRVEFRSPNFRGISGWQGTLSFDPSLQFEELVGGNGKLQLTQDHIGRKWQDQGLITMSWNNPSQGATGIDVDEDEVLFTMIFRANASMRLSEALRIGSQYTRAESYEGKGELRNLSLSFIENGKQITGGNELYQNYPNPFDARTVIGLNLAEGGKGTLKLFDVTGRVLKSLQRDWIKGYQEVWIDRQDIGGSGVLYYRFESSFFTSSRKMVLIDEKN